MNSINNNNNNSNDNKEANDRIKNLDTISRHKKFIDDYFNHQKNKKEKELENKNGSNYSSDTYKNYKSDHQILKENHQFLRDNNGDRNEEPIQLTYEEKLAKTYYDRLYKEYAIIDLSQYKNGEIGLRWRIESEVISGRGQFTCANKKCELKLSTTTSNTTYKREELKSFEVPFSYNEQNEDKVALVKVVLCPYCSKLLNYSNIKKKKKELKEYLKENKKKRKQRYSDNGEDKDSNSDGEDVKLKKNKTSTTTTTTSESNNSSKQNQDNDDDIFKDMFL